MQPALDLDGVLADLHTALLMQHSLSPDLFLSLTNWEMSANPGMPTDEELWAPVNQQGAWFWANLPLTEFAKEIVERAGPEAYVVTAPTTKGIGACVEGKMSWIAQHFPQFQTRLVFAKQKGLVAKPSTFLVDDKPENCWDWIATPGARAILWPAPYNTSTYSNAAMRTTLEQITHLTLL